MLTRRPACSSRIFVQTYKYILLYIGKRIIVRSKKGSPVYSKDSRDARWYNICILSVEKLKQFIRRRTNTKRKLVL